MNKKNQILELICKIEKNYSDNFKAQTEFLRKITNKAIKTKGKFTGLGKDSYLDPYTFILDFLGRGNEGRKDIASEIMENDWNKEGNIIFLGIQNLTRTKFSHLDKKVTKECENNAQDTDVQKCLRSIFCQSDNNENCLKENLDNDSFTDLKKIFPTPNSTVTSVLYWLYPKQFIPFDKNSKKLYNELGLKLNNESLEIKENWNCYSKVIEALKEIHKNSSCKLCLEDESFKPSMMVALSFASWLMENQIDNILNNYLENSKDKSKNIILTGMPGTGKTFAVKEFIEDKKYDYEFVQFHPSYDYEDFIEGLKPIPSKNGQIEFKLINGVFKKLCQRAFKEKNKKFVMIIDEINRANLSRVFGELLYCLEYRDEFVSTKMTSYIQELNQDDKKLYSVSNDENNIGKFVIPSNIIILGTMNEVDRSVDAFDLALRRRFIWEDIDFSETALRLYQPFFTNNFQEHIEDLIKKAKKLNDKLGGDNKNKKDIDLYIGANYKLGHTYYFKIIDYYNGDFDSALCDLWNYHIKSIVREYCKIKFGEDELNEKLEKYKEIIIDKNNRNV